MRAIFASPVALLFIGGFVALTNAWFFAGSRFFARNLADVRPLFEQLPLFLIFLVAAVTMRMWADERRSGTLEVLTTLPISTADLVLGKFGAAKVLVFVSLLLTLPIPFAVATLGDLDWGPVIGGYFATYLLALFYASIGLCVSSRTDNQVVALVVTVLVCLVFYLIGSPLVVDVVGTKTGEMFRQLGTGSRFASIERGVLDLRDILYYLSGIAFFLVLNGVFLHLDRIDRNSERGRRSFRRLGMLAGLVLLNVILLNVWLARVPFLRADLTADKEFSISRVTKDTLRELDEPLFIEGYFSDRTHPLLAPLGPRIRDTLEEYRVAGRGRVRVSVADPGGDEELQERLQQDYGIRSIPMRVADRTQQAIVNAFFHIVVRYGDQSEVLSFDDLIDVRMGSSEPDVRLKNIEYDLTKTIRQVSRDFQTIESLLAMSDEDVELTLYASPATIPEAESEVAEALRSVARELASDSERFSFAEVDPSADSTMQQELFDSFGIRPLALDLFGTQTYYFDVLLRRGDTFERILPGGDSNEGDIRRGIESSIRRMTPGQLTTVGFYTNIPPQVPPNPQLPPQFQPPQAQPDYRFIQQTLGADYSVEVVDLSTGIVPATIDTLVIGKAGALDDKSLYAVDQFLMRGGSLVVLAGRYGVDIGQQGLSSNTQPDSIFALLETWGVGVDEGMILDAENIDFPIPVQERRSGLTFQRIELTPYAPFVDLRGDRFARRHAAVSGISAMSAPWASPLTLEPPEGVEATELLFSSERSCVNPEAVVQPDSLKWSDSGFGCERPAGGDVPLLRRELVDRGRFVAQTRSEDGGSYVAYDGEVEGFIGRRPIAAALTGRFPSHFAGQPSPLIDAPSPEAAADSDSEPDRSGRTIESSIQDGRLIVVGSSEIVSDLVMQLAMQPGGEGHRGNATFMANVIDWSTEETDLLEIRSAGAFARTLRPLDDKQRSRVEWTVWLSSLALLILVIALPRLARRRQRSFAETIGGVQQTNSGAEA